MQEADGFEAGGEDPEARDTEDEGIAGLLAAVLVLVSAQRGDPPEIEIPTEALMDYFTCYIMALAAEMVSRRTDIWLEPPTVANIFDTARQVHAKRRTPEGS